MSGANRIEVKARVLREMDDNASCRLLHKFTTYEQFLKHDDIRRNGIGFTALLYNTNDGLVYCGLTSYETDILYTFNPKTKEFRSLGFPDTDGVELYDVKVHRSLCLDDDGMIYGATAGLHGVPQYHKAPGGKVFRYDPGKDKIEILAIPMPHEYIQTIVLDSKRKIIYGIGPEPAAHMFRYDIKKNKTKDLGLVFQGAHRPCVDRDGNFWASYQDKLPATNPGHRLVKYDTDKDELHYGPWPDSCNMIAKEAIDDMVLGPDGMIYIGTELNGELLRLNPGTNEMEYLGKPFHNPRMDVKFGTNGLVYLAVGQGDLYEGGYTGRSAGLFTYDIGTGRFDFLGYIFDEQRKEGAVMVHDITVVDEKTVYVAESDNLVRTPYLWECNIG